MNKSPQMKQSRGGLEDKDVQTTGNFRVIQGLLLLWLKGVELGCIRLPHLPAPGQEGRLSGQQSANVTRACEAAGLLGLQDRAEQTGPSVEVQELVGESRHGATRRGSRLDEARVS